MNENGAFWFNDTNLTRLAELNFESGAYTTRRFGAYAASTGSRAQVRPESMGPVRNP
jgi:hypothetical protein